MRWRLWAEDAPLVGLIVVLGALLWLALTVLVVAFLAILSR